jgi:hypothetical protein
MFARTRTFLHALAFTALLAIVAVLPQTVQAQAFSDYAENTLVDRILRGQAATFPTTLFVGLSTTACSDSTVGTEVSGNNYARSSVAASLTNFSGTQSSGSTTASSGTGGVSSNNNAINFPTPSGSWGTVTHWFISDASSGGNLWFCAALTQSKVINSGDTVSFASGALTITVQ